MANRSLWVVVCSSISLWACGLPAQVTVSQTVSAPTLSAAAGTYSGSVSVSLASPTTGASIRYTLDGSAPTSTTGTLFSSAITITATTTLKAIAYKTGMTSSSVTTATYTITTTTTTPSGQVAAPTFSPDTGNYTSTQSVALASATQGATIRYTLDGSTPTATTGTVYSSAISIAATTTLKAIATLSGMTDSAVSSATYTISSPTQAVIYYSTAWSTTYIHYGISGTWTTSPGVVMDETACDGWAKKSVDLGSATSMAVVFNNGSGTWDNNSGNNYTVGLGLSTVKGGVVTANATDPCGAVTPVITASPAAGTYATTQSVTLTSTSSGDKIYYTTDGTTPTTSSTLYTAPLTLTASTTVRAFGVNTSSVSGAIASFAYVIDPNFDDTAPTLSADPVSGTYSTGQLVTFTLSDDKAGVSTAYYTTDGTTPTTSSAVYVSGDASAGISGASLNVSQTTIFNFLLVDAAGNQATTSFAYKIGTSGLTDFRKESIYFLITPRFYDGDTTNNMHCWDDTTAKNPDTDPCYRGDFRGLIQKLDYIKALGFSAIWITPVVENSSGYDYHGYHTLNFKKIDPRLESSDTSYQTLVSAVHAKGMKLIQDIVLNHSGNFGEENLFPLFSKDWSTIYDANHKAVSMSADTAAGLVDIAPSGKLPSNYASLLPAAQYSARINAMKEDTSDVDHIYHHEKNLTWEGYTVETGQIAGDCVDLNTENPTVSAYLRDAYDTLIDEGADGFRIDTVKHISRLTMNNEFIPQFLERGGENFFMFGEIAALYENVINSGIPAISPFFYTWKESKTYPWGDRATNEASTLSNWDDNDTTANLPSSNNACLNGVTYHTPDYSEANGFHVIDFPMHWAFINAHNAFNMALSNDQLYNDSTWNVVYVASHDYSPDQSPQNERFSQSQAVWAENMDLMFTFRGIPTLYYGDEIEFQKGLVIDPGEASPLSQTGRAYFGDHIEGSVTVTDFGKYTNATGAMATTLNYPLAIHVRELNLIRRAIPALQLGQYNASSSYASANGGIAFIRRYTDSTTDSLALVTISSDATFTGIPNGTYVDAVTGNSITVKAGSLTTSGCSGQGNMRVYVLSTSLTPAPGKVVDATTQTYLK